MKPLPDKVLFCLSFTETPVSIVDVWTSVVDYLRQSDCLPKQWKVSPSIRGDGQYYPATSRIILDTEEITQLLVINKQPKFWVDTGHSDQSVAYILLHNQLSCRIEANSHAPGDWSALIEDLMRRFASVGAWQWRHLYHVWQGVNEYYPGYETRFGTLPRGCNPYHQPSDDGIGPGKTLFDISLYPGRPKELKAGVNFYPTSEMWLGPHFWQHAKCTKEDALTADFWIEKRDTPDYLYLKCWPQPFTRPDGEQGRMQQRLWKLFFHEYCEWPPGSATICDEPMYGPPQLMPLMGATQSAGNES